MNVVLVVFICAGRACDWTPQYAVEFPTMDACIVEKGKHGNGANINQDKAICVPLTKLK